MKSTKPPANSQWDSGQPPAVIPETTKPKRKYKRRNKRATAKVYMMAYKQVIKTLSPEAKRRVLDPQSNDEISRQFVKAVIALAEQDDLK